MNRWCRMALGFAALLAASGEAEAQGLRLFDGRRAQNFVEYGAPDPGRVPTAQFTNSEVMLPPGVYSRRATPRGGLIETAARRINPFSPLSRARDVTFTPSPYRQPEPDAYDRVMRPVYGAPGYHQAVPTVGTGLPGAEAIPGVNCPTCPK